MDKFLLKVCHKDTKTKPLRHFLSIFIVNLEWVSVQRTSNGSYVTPFLNRASILESFCLLRDGFNFAMKNVSNEEVLRVLASFGAVSKNPTKKSAVHYQQDL